MDKMWYVMAYDNWDKDYKPYTCYCNYGVLDWCIFNSVEEIVNKQPFKNRDRFTKIYIINLDAKIAYDLRDCEIRLWDMKQTNYENIWHINDWKQLLAKLILNIW